MSSTPLDAAIAEIVAEIGRAAWFAACGEALAPSEREDAALLAAAFDFADAPIATVGTWREAAAATQRLDWSRAWWERESAAERALKDEARGLFGAEHLLEELSRVTRAAAALDGEAARSMGRCGVADQALSRVASGAAAQACHQAALALAADASLDHAFAVKFRLFTGGRWPLGVVGGRLLVF